MHSVGALGHDERVDAMGTLHSISWRNQQTHNNSISSYNTLSDLFVAPNTSMEALVTSTSKSLRSDENEEDDDDTMEVVVTGGSLQAAVFGIIKGTVGPAILYII